jgi:hypothetical protein
LGNELIPWARAMLAAELLGARLLPPAFGRNRRRYWRHFDTPRYDWVRNRALQRLLPRVDFTEADWRAHGGGDVRSALRGFAVEHRLFERRRYALTTSGMWGGYRHIEAARARVRSLLEHSHYAAGNLERLAARLDPARITVGMHVRLGDFKPARSVPDYRGRWNAALPLEWYVNIARNLRRELGAAAQFLVVTDGKASQLQPLADAVPCVQTADIPDSDCSDLLALANADLLVCSISSFSLWAAFLSDAPYLWYAPSLQVDATGRGSLWGGGSGAEAAGVVAADSAGLPRGMAIGADGALPATLSGLLARRQVIQWPGNDLVLGGFAPLPATARAAG